MPSATPLTIVGLGEAVFDIFPERSVLGGATLNLAVCVHQCLQLLGGKGIIASRIGDDDFGRRLHRSLRNREMETDFVQLDPTRPTGQVLVTFEKGEPSYEICSPTAWDAMQFDRRWSKLASSCNALCFGTLAQRSAMSREAVQQFLRTASQALKLVDLNLRQDYYSAELIQESLTLADAAKLNELELGQIGQLLNWPPGETSDAAWCDRQCLALAATYELEFVALTRGPRGTVLYCDHARHELERVSYPPHPDADSVGAGDAASAGLLLGHVLAWTPARTLELANHLGAFLASVPGATPKLSNTLLEMVTS